MADDRCRPIRCDLRRRSRRRVVGAYPRLQIKFTVPSGSNCSGRFGRTIDVGVASIVGLEKNVRLVAEPLPRRASILHAGLVTG